MEQLAWRDTTSKECQDDFEALLDEAIEFAAERICTEGSTPIFAIGRPFSGNEELYVAEEGVAETMQQLGVALSPEAEHLRSVVICAEVFADGAQERQLAMQFDNREISIRIVQGFTVPNSTTFNLADDMHAGKAEPMVAFS